MGHYVLDLALLKEEGLFGESHNQSLFNQPTLNYFATLGPNIWSAVRQRIQELLSVANFELQASQHLLSKA